jgi:phosphoribosylaminoimidazole-succinocarboxamide synthase
MTSATSSDAELLRVLADEPLYEGKSKRVWAAGPDTCVVEVIPSLSSFTYQREALFDGTGQLRLDFYELAADRLRDAGIETAFVRRLGDTHYLAKHCPSPPFETIVKNFAVGSTIRKYPGLFREGEALRWPIVKFDYRCEPEDQPIGEDYLRLLGHPVEEWRHIALETNRVLRNWLAPRRLIDFCVIIGRDGDGRSVVNSEVSPDCMRLRSPDGRPLDKDLFRLGADEAEIVRVWRELVRSLGAR